MKTMFKRDAFAATIIIMILVIALFSSCGKNEELQASPSASQPASETSIPSSLPAESPDISDAPQTDPLQTDALQSDAPQIEPPHTEPPQTEPPLPHTEPPFEKPDKPESFALLAETEDMGQEYIDKIIFLGDSTTYGMKYYGVLSGGKNTTQVWTPASGTLTLSNQGFATIVYPVSGEEIPIRDAVELEKPEMMVITLGVNGVSFMEEDYFKSEYKALVEDIKEISPDTKIILQSIFPIASNYEYQRDINNTKISAANGWILAIAEETDVKYLDTASILLGDDGFLPQAYHNGDGLHLNGETFELVLGYIRTHGYS